MRNVFAVTVLLGAVMIVSGCGTVSIGAIQNSPAVGSSYEVDGVKNIVVGSGNQPFEYVSTGESLILQNLSMKDWKAVYVPDEGVLVQVDPSKPSCLVGDVEKLDSNWPAGSYVLVEYDRANN